MGFGRGGGGEGETRTRKRLLDIDALAGARLHEAAAPGARPLEALAAADAALLLEVALVAGHDLDGRHLARVLTVVGLHVDHIEEVRERVVQRGRGRDVVHQQEGVRAQVRRRPQRAVLFLAGGVGQGEEVGLPVDGAGYGVGVFC